MMAHQVTSTIKLAVAAGISLLLLAGCSSKRSSEELGLAAVDVTGSVSNLESVEGWTVPQKRRVTFYVCLVEDKRQSKATPGKFEIRGGPARVETPSNSVGCVNWYEDFTINAFAKPTYIEIERKIVGISEPFHKGEVTLRIAVNPWSGLNGSEPAVVFLDRVQVPRIVRMGTESIVMSREEDLVPVQVAINDLSGFGLMGLQYQPAMPRVSFVLKPKFLLTSMTGGLNSVPLTEGWFDLQLHLYRTRKLDPRRVEEEVAQSTTIKGRLMGGAIVVTEQKLELLKPVQVNDEDIYWAKLIMVPHEPHPKGLVAVSQKFLIGTLSREIPPTLMAAPDSNGGAQGKELVARALKPAELPTLLAPRVVDPAQIEIVNPYDFEGEVTATRVGVPRDRNRDRQTIQLQFEANITTRIDPGAPLRQRWFKIRHIGSNGQVGEWKEKDTTTSGALIWFDNYTFDYYDRRTNCGKRAEKHQITIEIVDKENPKYRLTRKLQIQPWSGSPVLDLDAGGTVICNSSPLDEENEAEEHKFKPFFMLASQCLATVETSPVYDLTRELNLSVDYQYAYSASPQIYYPDHPSNPFHHEDLLRAGFYRLTMAVVRPMATGDKVENSVIATTQKVIQLDESSGQMNQIIHMKLNDPLLAPVRNWAVVQLEMVDEDSIKKDVYGQIDPASVTITKNENLFMPPYGFQMFANPGGCEPKLTNANDFRPGFESVAPKPLASVIRSMRDSNLTVVDLHTQFQSQQAQREQRLKAPLSPYAIAKSMGYRFIDLKNYDEAYAQIMKRRGEQGFAQHLLGRVPKEDATAALDVRSALPRILPEDLPKLKAALDCMHEVTYGNWRHQWAKCFVDDYKLIQVVQRLWCQEVPRRFDASENLQLKGAYSHHSAEAWAAGHRNQRSQAVADMCESDDYQKNGLRETLWVEKRILVEEFGEEVPNKPPRAEVVNGWISDVSVAIGSNPNQSFGTLLQYEDINREKVSIGFSGGLAGIAASISALSPVMWSVSIFSTIIKDMNFFKAPVAPAAPSVLALPAPSAAPQINANSGGGPSTTMMGYGGGRGTETVQVSPGERKYGVSGGVSWKYDLLNWVQRFMVPVLGASIGNRASFSVERQDVVYRPKRYRECYFIHGTVPPSARVRTVNRNPYEDSDWSRLRDMICLPSTEEPIAVREQYYSLAQTLPVSQGIGLDTKTPETVVYMRMRGEREFHMTLQAFEEKIGTIQYNRSPVGVMRTLRNARELLEKMRNDKVSDEIIQEAEAEVSWVEARQSERLMAINSMIAVPQPPVQNYYMFGDENVSDIQSRFFGFRGLIRRYWHYYVGQRGSGLNVEDKDVMSDPERLRHREFYRRRQSVGHSPSTATPAGPAGR